MEWTGERMLADEIFGLGATEHLHRYAIAMDLVNGKTVLDIASGEGYGAFLLSSCASHVTGIDISESAINFAKKKYTSENLEFVIGNTSSIPLPNNCIDCIVSFETIEHHDQHNEMLSEFKRVLKADGIIIISTPAKENYDKLKIDNRYHIKELTSKEFYLLISNYFKYYKVLRQRYVEASFMYPIVNEMDTIDEYKGNFLNIERNNFRSSFNYNIIICSNSENSLPNVNASFFDGLDINAIRNTKLKAKSIAKMENHYLKSTSFKLGSFILKPFIIISNIFRKRQ